MVGSAGAVKRCQKADKEFPRLTPHGLRHVAVSHWLAAGIRPEVAMRMAGHETLDMTMRLYGAIPAERPATQQICSMPRSVRRRARDCPLTVVTVRNQSPMSAIDPCVTHKIGSTRAHTLIRGQRRPFADSEPPRRSRIHAAAASNSLTAKPTPGALKPLACNRAVMDSNADSAATS